MNAKGVSDRLQVYLSIYHIRRTTADPVYLYRDLLFLNWNDLFSIFVPFAGSDEDIFVRSLNVFTCIPHAFSHHHRRHPPSSVRHSWLALGRFLKVSTKSHRQQFDIYGGIYTDLGLDYHVFVGSAG